MGRIVWLWLLLTPLWIAFSFYASVSKIAFIPPALVVVAVALHWLHKQFVLRVAGEPEPRTNAQPARSLHFSPVAASPLLRPALIAVGVGACVGAAATPFFLTDRSHYAKAVWDNSTAPPAPQSNAAIGVPTKAVKLQSFAAEPKPAQTEAVKSQPLSAEPKVQDNSRATSSDNPDAKPAQAQIQPREQNSADQPRCNVSLCESSYQSFRASDCTYQPYSGPRQYCAR